jgi:hypothetical protein
MGDGTPAVLFRFNTEPEAALVRATANAQADDLRLVVRWNGREFASAPTIASRLAVLLAADTGPAGDPEAFTRWALATFPAQP